MIEGGRLFAPQTGKRLLPLASLRAGENQLRVRIDGAPSASFDFRAHLRNYAGIAPDFPRVFIVADEAVAERNRNAGIARLSLPSAPVSPRPRFAVVLVRVVGQRRRRGARLTLLVAPSVILWAAVLYSFSSPLHIWLSLEAVAVMALVGLLIAALLLWIGRHRVAVLRAAAVALVTLVSLEVALRVFNDVRPSFVFYADGYNRYRGRPDAPFFDAQLNSRGFNDIDHPLQKPTGVRSRIVAIGDSATMGVVPYRHNYLTLLESDLGGAGPVEIVNMGVSATTPNDYVDMLVNEGLAFNPDLVLANIFIGNDFETPGRKPWEYRTSRHSSVSWPGSGTRRCRRQPRAMAPLRPTTTRPRASRASGSSKSKSIAQGSMQTI